MKFTFTFSILLVFSVMLSCGTEDKPAPSSNTPDTAVDVPTVTGPIIERYYVRFLEKSREMRAEAMYYEGASLKRAKNITMQAVYFRDFKMNAQDLGNGRGIRYAYRTKVPYNSNFKFQYQNHQGESTTRNFELAGISDFVIREGDIKRTKGATLEWQGEALKEGQSLVILFTDAEQKASSVTVEGPTTLPEIALSSEQLSNLSPGIAKLNLVKKQNYNRKEEGRLILESLEYYTNAIKVEVK